MKIYFAGGLEKEEEQMKVVAEHGLPFNRLLSFFYPNDIKNFVPIMKKHRKKRSKKK